MRKVRKMFLAMLLLVISLAVCSLTSCAEEVVELNLGEIRKVAITENFGKSLVWQSSNPNVVTCSGESFETAEDPFKRIYTCDFTAQATGSATVTAIDEFSGSTVGIFHVMVSKYHAIQCANAKFEVSVTSSVNQMYTISCSDGSTISSVLVGTSTMTVGSYSRYTKTYAVSIAETGEHVLTISGSSGNPLTYHVNILNHSWGSASTSIPATCTSQGVRNYTCTRCQTTKQEEIPALGHEYNESWTVDTEASCVAVGVKSRHCKRCDARIDIQEIPIIEHVPGEWETSLQETCVTDGREIKKCVACKGTLEERIIQATGHDNGKWEVEAEPSCITGGKEARKCTKCQCVLEERSILATGHDFGEWQETKPATCTESGIKSSACSKCQEVKTEGLPAKGHDWNVSATIDKVATCVADGQQSIHCKNCSEQKDITVIPAVGHSFGELKVTKPATCSLSGIKSASCSRCQEVKTESVPAKGHIAGAWEVAKQASVLSEGEKVQKCAVCNSVLESVRIEKIPAVVELNVNTLPLQVKKKTTVLKISSFSSGDSVLEWKSSKPKVVAVNQRTGKLTAKKVGTAYITVTMKSGATATCKVKVQKGAVKTSKITVAQKTVQIKKGKSYTVRAVKAPLTSLEKVTYKTSNKKIATVNSKGKIVGKKKGKATITVKSGKKKVKIKVIVD